MSLYRFFLYSPTPTHVWHVIKNTLLDFLTVLSLSHHDHLRSLTLQCLSATILTIRISPFSPPSQAHPRCSCTSSACWVSVIVLQVRVNDARSRRTSSHRVLDILLPHKIDEKLCSALFSFHRFTKTRFTESTGAWIARMLTVTLLSHSLLTQSP